MVIDNFIDSYSELKELSLTCDFQDLENPSDGVIYPNIFANIPEQIKSDILAKLKEITSNKPKDITMFMRMSPSGVYCPHKVHHDLVMGNMSLMLYLNDGDGGTSFVKHNETGIAYAPVSRIFSNIIEADQNNPEQWTITESVKMKQNRALIFDASRMHCAEPIGGFGENQKDSRIVLTCFFS